MLSQKVSDLTFDGFCFLLGSDETKQPVVRISTVGKPPEVWIVRVSRWKLLCFFVLVKLVEVDITQNWAENSTLRCAAVRSVVPPFFEVSSLKEFLDESKEASIMNVLGKRF